MNMSWARCCRSIKTRYEFVSKQLTTYPQCVPHTNTAGATRRVKCVTIDKHKLNIVVSKLLLNLREKLNDCRREPYESSSHILHTEKHYPLLTIHGWMTTDNVCVLRSLKRSKHWEVTVSAPPLFPRRALVYMVVGMYRIRITVSGIR